MKTSRLLTAVAALRRIPGAQSRPAEDQSPQVKASTAKCFPWSPRQLDDTIEHHARELAAALNDAGVADRWKRVFVTGHQLASLLLTSVAGSAQLYPGPDDYQDRIRAAVAVILAGDTPS